MEVLLRTAPPCEEWSLTSPTPRCSERYGSCCHVIRVNRRLNPYSFRFASIQHILKGGPEAPDLLGQLLVSFRRALDSGPRGVEEMKKALATSLESAYLFSPVHNSALELYRLSLEGKLKSGDEPAALIKAVIERNTMDCQIRVPIADSSLKNAHERNPTFIIYESGKPKKNLTTKTQSHKG